MKNDKQLGVKLQLIFEKLQSEYGFSKEQARIVENYAYNLSKATGYKYEEVWRDVADTFLSFQKAG